MPTACSKLTPVNPASSRRGSSSSAVARKASSNADCTGTSDEGNALCRAFLVDTPWSAVFVSWVMARAGLPVRTVMKVSEGSTNIQDMVEQGELQLIINTPLGARAHDDSRTMRAAAVMRNVPLLTTLSAAAAAVNGIAALKGREEK